MLEKHNFKFQSKRQQLANLQVNLSFERDEESFFVEEINELRDLDLTLKMTDLLSNLKEYSKSLETVLFYKNNIEDLLLGALGKASIDTTNLAVESTEITTVNDELVVPNVMRLVKAFCKDLDKEVYPFLLKALPFISRAIPKLEVEFIQMWFESLLTIFKLFSKQLTLDYELVLTSFKTVFISDFQNHMARTLAILTRKLPNFDLILNSTFNIDQKAIIIAEAFKVSGEFHSNTEKWITSMMLNEYDLELCSKVFILLGHYGTAENMKDLFEICMKLYQQNIDNRPRYLN